MTLLLLEALGAMVLLILIVWWTMFSGRKNGEPNGELSGELKADAKDPEPLDQTRKNKPGG